MRSPREAFWSAPFPRDGDNLDRFPNPDDIDLVAGGLTMISADANGFATSGAIFFPLSGPIEAREHLEEHVIVRPLEGGPAHPVRARFYEDARPFGAKNLLAVLPVQGVPLLANTKYVAMVKRSLGDLQPAESEAPVGEDDLAGWTVFTTGDPTASLARAVEAIDALPAFEGPFVLRETRQHFLVYSSTISMPIVFQNSSDESEERARVFLTVPRTPKPAGGYPVLVFVRTGGGGDRPMIDRGRRAVAGGEPVEDGPALQAALAGFAGLSIDGPHGGPLRNVSNQDEQFLVFNFLEPAALRDNILQSAYELVIAARLLDGIELAGDGEGALLDTEHVAIMGHSMGATIAPLAIAFEPKYRAAILSGAGASWIENLIHKEKPLVVRPLAEQLLDYPSKNRVLDELDPVLTIVQWAVEPADPQVYAARAGDRHILMLQGIVDHYILPPIANALSLSLGLDLAGASLDRANAETARFPALESQLSLVGKNTITLPVRGNQGVTTRVVVQVAEDGVEDGHEVVFQLGAPKTMYGCFLESFARGVPVVPLPDEGTCR
jgi:pimeloyl-ACP methyl ester carboxylesterase